MIMRCLRALKRRSRRALTLLADARRMGAITAMAVPRRRRQVPERLVMVVPGPVCTIIDGRAGQPKGVAKVAMERDRQERGSSPVVAKVVGAAAMPVVVPMRARRRATATNGSPPVRRRTNRSWDLSVAIVTADRLFGSVCDAAMVVSACRGPNQRCAE